MPDYGRIHTYRSPAGFGIRLDGGSAYGGAVITPFYDSLLVKTTAWGREFRDACQRMDRCLREFRVRGVKTNIPFLENVVNHPDFQAGRVSTRWLEETPALFKFQQRKDRATKLLTYLADVIVNGNPSVAGKARPRHLREAPVPAHDSGAPAAGTRQKLIELGPEGFAQWTAGQKRLLITDTTFRDAHQSLLATRVRTYDMLAIANYVAHRLSNLYSLEMWGGATFDVTMRFLHESVRAIAQAAGGGAEHLFPDAAARVECGGVHGVSGQRGRGVHLRGGRAGDRHLPHFRFAELAAEYEGEHGGGAEDTVGMRGGDLLHGRHSRPEAR
jgi:pyruvate carboxylase